MPRLFVGGLSDQVDQNALESQFSQFGSISNVDLKEKTDPEGNVFMRFAYINLEAQNHAIQQCVRQMNGSSWLGSQLRVEVAKESFMERLKRERMEAERGEDPMNQQHSNNDSWDRFNKRRKEQDAFASRPQRPVENPWQRKGAQEEESMMSSFKNFSSFWDDNEEDSSYRKPRDYMDSNRPDYNDSYGHEAAGHEDENESYEVGDVKKEHEEQFKILKSMQDSSRIGTNYRSKATSRSYGRLEPIVRYDPTKDTQSQQKSNVKEEVPPEPKIQLSDTSKFVEVSKTLEFGQSSGFSFSSVFDAKKPEVEEEKPEEGKKIIASKAIYLPKHKKAAQKKRVKYRNFFLTSGDKDIQVATEWMPQSVTEEVSKQFYEMQGQLRDLIKRRCKSAQNKDKKEFPDQGRRRNAIVTLARDFRWRDMDEKKHIFGRN